ncbi:MAG TPA: hypothetical protein VF681_13080 [Abditibacteriaceae bacterium]|jgi:glutamate-ammonia-ligase adenylyltransferase
MLLRFLSEEKLDLAAAPVLENKGFADGARALRLLDSLAKRGTPAREELLAVVETLVDELEDSADPMRALLNLSNLADAVPDRAAFLAELQNARFRRRVCGLCGFAQSVADSLARRPENLEILRGENDLPSRGELRRSAREATDDGDEKSRLDSLRRWRKRETVRLALFDLETRTWSDEKCFSRLVRGISDQAIVAVQTALHIITPDSRDFCVLLMGKGGARELNYSSDVDLIFLHDGDGGQNEKIGAALLKALSDSTTEGIVWRSDMRLRPDGKSGALVPSISYALSYYESFAAAWEWQALIKARAIAGDAKLARRFRKFTRSITWARRADDSHIGEMLQMKRRMEQTAEGSDETNVKTGPGTIRDAEWIVQQLQMMTGPTHSRARAKATLTALQRLDELDAISPDEAARVREGYLWMRVVEHRLQLMDERAVRTLPVKADERAALARRLGETARANVAVQRFEEEHARHKREIRAQCEKIFWAWQEEHAESTVDFDRTLQSFSRESQTRLRRISEGTTSQPFPAPLARQIRVALPAALAGLRFAADADRALANLENLCEASGNRVSLLRSLADSPALARAVFTLLGGSVRLSDTVIRAPQLLDFAANRQRLKRKDLEEARFDCRDYVQSFENHGTGLRRWKTRELLRIGLRDLVLDAPSTEICAELADLCQSCLMMATDDVVRRQYASVNFAVLGMGKLGGGETHYNSDADVLFVYDIPPGAKIEGAKEAATKLAENLTRLMGERTSDGVCFELDARLRPDGRSGPLVRSIEGYIEYFERPNGLAAWERQALTRARFVAGDAATSARLMAAIRAVAFPEKWQLPWSDELRYIKGRVEAERGVGKNYYDVKLGAGAIADIEWSAQWLAMKNGARFSDLQTPNTLRQLAAAHQAHLISDDEWTKFRAAYEWLRGVELRLQILSENSARAVRKGTPEAATWARSVFPDDAHAVEHFEEAWQTRTSRVRPIFERIRDEL